MNTDNALHLPGERSSAQAACRKRYTPSASIHGSRFRGMEQRNGMHSASGKLHPCPSVVPVSGGWNSATGCTAQAVNSIRVHPCPSVVPSEFAAAGGRAVFGPDRWQPPRSVGHPWKMDHARRCNPATIGCVPRSASDFPRKSTFRPLIRSERTCHPCVHSSDPYSSSPLLSPPVRRKHSS